MKLHVVFQSLIVLIYASTCLCQVNEDLVFTDKDTFLKFRCGMSKEEMEKIVNVKLIYDKKLNDYIIGNYLYNDIPSMASFRVKGDKLISLRIYLKINNKNTSDMIKDFFRIKKILEDEYGEYYYNGTRWNVKIDNPTLEDYTHTLENENVELYFMWKTTKMEINYNLYKDSNYPLGPYNMYIWVICSGNE